jgi:hypothetical protein
LGTFIRKKIIAKARVLLFAQLRKWITIRKIILKMKSELYKQLEIWGAYTVVPESSIAAFAVVDLLIPC